MIMYRVRAELQALPDLPIGQIFGDQLEDFPFLVAQEHLASVVSLLVRRPGRNKTEPGHSRVPHISLKLSLEWLVIAVTSRQRREGGQRFIRPPAPIYRWSSTDWQIDRLAVAVHGEGQRLPTVYRSGDVV